LNLSRGAADRQHATSDGSTIVQSPFGLQADSFRDPLLPPKGVPLHTDLVFALAFGIGVVAGLRSLTAPAAVSWAAHLGWLQLQDSSLAFMGSTPAVVIFSLLASAEYVADLLPSTPRRTTPGPLIARIVMGALCGACLCASGSRPVSIGAVLGGLGGLFGAFAGYQARIGLVKALGVKDRVIALLEDAVTIVLAWVFVSWR
jgi:uncharacterized membrane protein